MYIKNIDAQKQSVQIFYNTVYIKSSTKNFISIQKIVLSEGQQLEQKKSIQINTEPKFILNIVKDN